MAKITDLKYDPPKILLFGPPGSGKSLFAATGGEAVQFIDIDHNLRGCMTYKDKWTEERQKVDVIECRDTSPGMGTFMKANGAIISISNQIYQKKYPFKVLVLDSLTSLGEHSMRQIMSMAGRLGKNPTQPEWGLGILQVENLLQVLKGLPIAVILIAHQSLETVDNETKITVSAIGRKLPATIPSYFDEIWYTKLIFGAGNTQQFVIQSAPSPAVIARSGGGLPNNFNQNEGLRKALSYLQYDIAPTSGPAPSTN